MTASCFCSGVENMTHCD